MVRISGLCCLLMMSSWYQVCYGNPFMFAMEVTEKAMVLYRDYKDAKESLKPGKNDPSNQDVYNKLNALDRDLHEMKRDILNKISQDLRSKIEEATNDFFGLIKDIEIDYRLFRKYLLNPERYPDSIPTFANASATPGLSGKLYTTHQKLYEKFVDRNYLDESLLTLISKNSTASDITCIKHESKQQLINDLFKAFAESNLKATLITIYAYDMKEKYENKTYPYEKEDAKTMFFEQINNASLVVKEALRVSSRKIWQCDPLTHQQGITYDKLQQVFQAYFLYNYDLKGVHGTDNLFQIIATAFDLTHTCAQIAGDKGGRIRQSKGSRYLYDIPGPLKCWGRLRDCKKMNRDHFQVCYSQPTSERRYEWVRDNVNSENAMFGVYVDNCPGLSQEWGQGIGRKCVCNCETEERYCDRYFSLQDVLADDNKVVTGAKLTKDNHVFHIQIQQGTLGPNGTIIDKPEWKKVNTITSLQLRSNKISVQHPTSVDFYKNDLVYAVTYNQKTVYLDFLEHKDPKRLVTGMRFQQIGDDLRFEIRTTPFDYASGQLDKAASSWLCNINTRRARNKLVLQQPDDPVKHYGSNDVSPGNQYVKFRMTDLKKDVGSYTVPFIDIQEVITTPPMPLSGAGLIHRGQKESGGFLGLQVAHYNYTRHL